jgi:two-component system response regulator PilR (NtrC family)
MKSTDLAKARILVIDREQSSIDELKTVLSKNGYEVVSAMTGREGLEQTSRQVFDVIISDLLLPDISGLDLLSEIKQSEPDVKVYLMGTHITPAVILESVNRGAYDLLYKPFVTSSIIHMIEHSLNRDRRIRISRDNKSVA